MNESLINILGSIIANATPLVIAAIGETISERAGVTNLSLDGSLALSAMVGFVAALLSGNVWVGIAAAILVGALVALLIAVLDIELRQDQIAVGFVLTLLASDLAQFLGGAYTRTPGPTLLSQPIPILGDLPVIGTIFFRQSAFVYISYILIIGTWYWLFHTRMGLALRAIGERPEAAFARGTSVNRLRIAYTVLGGALIGLGGAAYSLALKPGWSTPPAMRGDGWIVLAIVIFGGWHPFRVVLGAYLFAGLRALSSAIQRSPDVQIPLVLLNGLPWLLMIVTLVLVSGGVFDRLLRLVPERLRPGLRAFLSSRPPAALGRRFRSDT